MPGPTSAQVQKAIMRRALGALDLDLAGLDLSALIKAYENDLPLTETLASATYGRYGKRLTTLDLPEFTRKAGNPAVLSAAAQNPAVGAASPTTAGSLYWPWRIKASDYLSSPLDQWYLYCTTNHEGTHDNSGVWLWTGPTRNGPWTGRGRVFIDNVSGAQTETASVVWAEDESLFFMYYQQQSVAGANGTQSTLLATSPDGVTWTRVGVVADVPAGEQFPGDGHTGYFRPFRIGKQWFAYSLLGGGNRPHFGLWRSHNGRLWFLDPQPLTYAGDRVSGVGIGTALLAWNSVNVVRWRNRLLAIFEVSDFISGGADHASRIACAYLSDDLRQITSVPKVLLYPPVSPEQANKYAGFEVVEDEGELHLLMVNNNVLYAATSPAS